MATSLEHMTADEVGKWLKQHGFSEDIVDGFEGQSYKVSVGLGYLAKCVM